MRTRLPSTSPLACCLALACAGALAGCGSSTKTVIINNTVSSPSSQRTTTSGQATAASPSPSHPVAAGVTVHLTTFRTPSSNIGCVLLGGIARCDIRQRSWSPPPRPAACTTIVDFGQGLALGRSGAARFVCAGDTALDPRAAVLAYGNTSRVGPYSCTSRVSGMTCRNLASGHGYFISRQRYAIF
jgi:hypothetical protein